MELLRFILCAYGLTQIIVYGKIFNRIRFNNIFRNIIKFVLVNIKGYKLILLWLTFLFNFYIHISIYNRKNCFFGEGLSKNLFKNYLTINCFSHTLLCEGLLYNNVLNNNCKIVFFSSLAGSINLRGKLKHQKFGGNIFYRISKSALNSAVKNISYELTPSSKIVVSLHPGWVKTDSGEEVADLEVGVAARNIKKLISNINKKDHGKFLNYNGRTLKW